MVWKRTTSGRTVYYACATYRGRQVRHLVGPDKREAERVERALKKAIVEGAYSPEWSFRRRVLLEAAGYPDLVPEEPHAEAARARCPPPAPMSWPSASDC